MPRRISRWCQESNKDQFRDCSCCAGRPIIDGTDFRKAMVKLVSAEPASRVVLSSLADALRRIAEMEKRIGRLEES